MTNGDPTIMPEETETTEVETEPEAPATEDPPAQATEPVEPTPASPPPPPSPSAVEQRAAVIDIDAELTAKEALADQLQAGEITYEDYAKKTVAHDRRITQAHRQMVEPARRVAQTIERQENAQQYWRQWGKGQDVAQAQYAKLVTAARAQQLYQQVAGEFNANPRYQRSEFAGDRGESIIYDKFIDALHSESTKKPNSAAARNTAPAKASGSAGAAAAPSGSAGKTARQKLDDGDYDFSADAKQLGMS